MFDSDTRATIDRVNTRARSIVGDGRRWMDPISRLAIFSALSKAITDLALQGERDEARMLDSALQVVNDNRDSVRV